ncbi:hypothetical protein QCA50_013279 [Cerrena zonata]|uniref:Secreted protein n=1 Tax=Cerrena zonata TaxID=2478898 RepID=A0AAW0FVU8_9APHY
MTSTSVVVVALAPFVQATCQRSRHIAYAITLFTRTSTGTTSAILSTFYPLSRNLKTRQDTRSRD